LTKPVDGVVAVAIDGVVAVAIAARATIFADTTVSTLQASTQRVRV
jgi:hypothetical protein